MKLDREIDQTNVCKIKNLICDNHKLKKKTRKIGCDFSCFFLSIVLYCKIVYFIFPVNTYINPYPVVCDGPVSIISENY